jgi:hypothetical protein
MVTAQRVGSLQQALAGRNRPMVSLHEGHVPFSCQSILQGLVECTAHNRSRHPAVRNGTLSQSMARVSSPWIELSSVWSNQAIDHMVEVKVDQRQSVHFNGQTGMDGRHPDLCTEIGGCPRYGNQKGVKPDEDTQKERQR